MEQQSNRSRRRRPSGQPGQGNQQGRQQGQGGNYRNGGQQQRRRQFNRPYNGDQPEGFGQQQQGNRPRPNGGRPSTFNAAAALEGPTLPVEGYLEVHRDGYGFLRTTANHGEARMGDAYVSADLIRQHGLLEGNLCTGRIAAPQVEDTEENFRRPEPMRGPRLLIVDTLEGEPAGLPHPKAGMFDRLTPVDPSKWLRLETDAERLTTRVIDMFTPIGKGTRGLIVAPPRTGKTILLQHLAEGIATNHPEVDLFVLLVDERPEEVTEMRRTIRGKVFASSNDRETISHTRIAQLVIERAKRLAERGRDVVVLLDSITRLARAYNKSVGSTGRTMSGGLDVKAMDVPKRQFGTARAFDEGGSLTVMATALIDTGSRMDEVIFQEFKGTGNMELVLDRKLADRRIFPAIDILSSGTRKEERLLPPETLERITLLRRSLLNLNDTLALESLLNQLKKHPNNQSFLESLSRFLK